MEYLSANGVKVKIGVADYEDVMELKSCIFDELKNVDFGFKFEDLERLTNTDADVDISKIIKAAMTVAASRPIQKALMTCLIKSTYNGHKITPQTFQDEKAREDYYEIIFNCLKVNLSPFFKPLVSKLSSFKSLIKVGAQTSS